MRDIYQYFDWLSCVIEDSGAESAEIDFEPEDSKSGVVDGVIYFFDGSRLEITEKVKLRDGRPAKPVYVYQYVGAGESVFRYDNAPHHPGLANFPHHKHVGSKRLSSIEPSLSQVLDEIADYISSCKQNLPPMPKRRRQTKKQRS